jgi:hypothetical protein
MPTFGIVWPWALLIVIAKLRRTGNFFRLNLKGSIHHLQKGTTESVEETHAICDMSRLHNITICTTIFSFPLVLTVSLKICISMFWSHPPISVPITIPLDLRSIFWCNASLLSWRSNRLSTYISWIVWVLIIGCPRFCAELSVWRHPANMHTHMLT